MIKVLAIDGGGIRGLVPAMVLEEIERRTRRPTAASFDLIAGASTGALLALGLTRPGPEGAPAFTASALRRLYEERGAEIFDRSSWRWLGTLGGLTDERYPAGPLERVLREYFGEARLREALAPVLVPAYAIELRSAFFFRSHRARRDPSHDFPMWEVARAATAAPTYFEPAELADAATATYYALIDGGVFANNPALAAYVEARTLFPKRERILVVSLGTGRRTRPLRYRDVRNWGLARWAPAILDVIFDGVSDTVDYELTHLLPTREPHRRYYRFQIDLRNASDALDDATPQNLRALAAEARALIAAQGTALDRLCAKLRA